MPCCRKVNPRRPGGKTPKLREFPEESASFGNKAAVPHFFCKKLLSKAAVSFILRASVPASPDRRPHRGAIAQLGERNNGIVEVRGSIPLGSTI